MTSSGALSIFGHRVTAFSPEAKAELAGLMRVGQVTTATSATEFASTDLIGQGDDAFPGWYVYVLQADNAAPEGLMKPMSDYVSSTGTITHSDFITDDLEVGDWVVLLRPEIAMLGTVTTAAASGEVTATDYLMAYVKQIVERERASQVSHVGDVASVSSNTFVVTDFIGYGNDYFYGWRVHVIWDAAGAHAAPWDEWRMCTDFATSTGTVTHNAFSAALGAADIIEMVHPSQYEAIAMRGGATTIQAVRNDQNAIPDMAMIPTSQACTVGTIHTLSDLALTSTTPFWFEGLWLGLENSAAGDSFTFRWYADWDGSSLLQGSVDSSWTFGGVQTPKWIWMPVQMWITYELAVYVVQSAGSSRTVNVVAVTGKRGA